MRPQNRSAYRDTLTCADSGSIPHPVAFAHSAHDPATHCDHPVAISNCFSPATHLHAGAAHTDPAAYVYRCASDANPGAYPDSHTGDIN